MVFGHIPRLFSHWFSEIQASCDVCGNQLHPHAYYLEEEVDVPDPRRSWMLCCVCNDAIKVQLDHMPLQSPHRVRVAVGLVASERADPSMIGERAFAGNRDLHADRNMEQLLIAFFLLCFAVHALVFIVLVLTIALR